jgi:hypothetical protein
VSLRNSFSHGSPINVSIQVVERYFNAGKFILGLIENIVYDKSTE